MILHEFRNINSSRSELKKFGVTVGAAFLILSALFFLFDRRAHLIPIYIGAILMISGVIFPIILYPFHKLWMGLAVILGFISTRAILTAIYYIILTPVALIGRLRGKDFLDERIERKKQSYWIYRTVDNLKEENIKNQY